MRSKFVFSLCCLLAVAALTGCSWTGAGNLVRGKGSAPPATHDDRSFEPINPFEMEKTINAYNQRGRLQLMAGTGSAALIQSAAAAELPDAALIENELLKLINLERTKGGEPELESDASILWAARIRSGELLDSFSHTRLDGSAYYTVFDEVDFSYAGKWHGENASLVSFEKKLYDENHIAWLIFEDLTESEGNYSNILREQYGVIGVGVSVSAQPDGRVCVASSQLFAGK